MSDGASSAMTISRVVAMLAICYTAFTIRLHAVNVYGRVIHEFDPWFNFRATDYLVNHGTKAFFSWYDEEAWYPLGRPVGTTIYPGLQYTAAYLYYGLQAIGIDMSLNDVCVFTPAVMAPLAVSFTAGMAYEVSGSGNAAVAAGFFMAIAPAHLMRSVAGGFDNESVAVAAIVATFYFWMRSLRNEGSWPWGFATAVAYIYMVAAWGGYTFVLNMVGLSAAVMVVTGNFTPNLHKSYSIFYLIGTLGAIQFPVVGLAPLKSLEQLGPMGIFFWLQLLMIIHRFKKMNRDLDERKIHEFQFMVYSVAVLVFAVVVGLLMPKGYLGPLSSRIRGLFVQHTRTGNPLVDSVAEHQATRDEMYWQYFHMVCFLAPVGFAKLFFLPKTVSNESKWFMISYTVVSTYFSRKMIRLILLLAPASSIIAGIALDFLITWSMAQQTIDEEKEKAAAAEAAPAKTSQGLKGKPKGKRNSSGSPAFVRDLTDFYAENIALRQAFGILMMVLLCTSTFYYWGHCQHMAENLSNPSIMLVGRSRDGKPVMIDDFRESYWWLRDNTPEDARVMAWWDYGYQINGIANRTTIADGNTWNHEHIALLGRALVSPVKKAHRIVRHLADYVLVWSTRYGGMYGDDIAKSPHMARIGGSVYKDIDPTQFYQDQQGNPSEMMRKSLIFNLVNFRLDPAIPELKPDTFKEVYTSKNNMVRIYQVLKVSKKSKKYINEGRGRQAFFSGQTLDHAYPPALAAILAGKEDFEQLEDFNRERKTKKEVE